MAIKVSRISTKKPKAPAAGAVVVATGPAKVGNTVMSGTSTDAAAALVGRYRKTRKGGKGCCPGKRGY
jgi:hypothetical protein